MVTPIPISIKEGFPPKWGYLVKDRCFVQLIITEVTAKAVAIMRTSRAQMKLQTLAGLWADSHGRSIHAPMLARRFQRLLDRFEEDPGKWPLTVMDWTMDNEDDAHFHHDPYDINPSQADYPFEDDILQLNGIRVYYLIRDIVRNNPAAYIRKFELIVTLVHEYAHAFICFLSYTAVGSREPRLASPRDHLNSEQSDRREAGYTFERLLFGGTYHRGWDGSGREHRFLPGLPLLETSLGHVGIPLGDILRITLQNPVVYTDTAIALNPVLLTHSTDPATRFPSFFDEFARTFNRDYRTVDNEPEISEAPLEILTQASDVDYDAVRWNQLHPSAEGRSGSFRSGSQLCPKSEGVGAPRETADTAASSDVNAVGIRGAEASERSAPAAAPDTSEGGPRNDLRTGQAAIGRNWPPRTSGSGTIRKKRSVRWSRPRLGH